MPERALPIGNLPAGATYRLRFRERAATVCFVRTAAEFAKFTLRDHGDHWDLDYKLGANVRGVEHE
jgi:hypothetical protein